MPRPRPPEFRQRAVQLDGENLVDDTVRVGRSFDLRDRGRTRRGELRVDRGPLKLDPSTQFARACHPYSFRG